MITGLFPCRDRARCPTPAANPQAKAQGRRDRDDIEFHIVARSGGRLTRALRLEGRDSAISWTASARRLVLLRKHRTFATGGVSLEIYELPAGRPSARG